MPRGVFIRTEAYRQKLREAMARRVNPNKSHLPEVREKIGAAQRGKPKSDAFRENLSRFYKGKPSFWKGRKASEETKRKMSDARRGNKHYNWKGGITSENNRVRSSAEYVSWRNDVYQRDGYKCQICGDYGSGVFLNADHIRPFALFPELRFDVDNGRTLCVPCHKATPNYGGKFRSRERTA